MVPLVLAHYELINKTYIGQFQIINTYWLNIKFDNHKNIAEITKKREYLGTNSPNQEATLAQSYSGFLENPPVIQWHETNDALVNTKNVLDKI